MSAKAPEYILKKSAEKGDGCSGWNRWREENPQIEINLSYVKFNGLNLSNANLSNTRLEFTFFKNCILQETDFQGAKLGGSVFNKAHANNTNFSSSCIDGCNFNDAKFLRADFSDSSAINAVFSGASLAGSDMRGANLLGANFDFSTCSNVDFGYDMKSDRLSRTNRIVRTSFYRADVSDSSFLNCMITNTDFQLANLSSCNFENSTIRSSIFVKANFEGAKFGNTVLADLSLGEANGLRAISHSNRSTIGMDVLNQSNHLDMEFLRGCGLSEWEIILYKLYDPNLNASEIAEIQQQVFNERAGSVIQFYSVFISYQKEDMEFAKQLHDALQKKGIRVWLDEKQMLPGDDIYDSITDGIKNWDKVILVASKNSLTKSWWVDHEIDKAFGKERQLMKSRKKKIYALIPLNLDNYLFSEEYESGKKSELQSRIAADFTDWNIGKEVSAGELERLVRALQLDGSREPRPLPLI